MQIVYRQLERLASVDYPAIIHGETGTGKELASRAIHFSSRRREKPFIPVNCGAIAESLLESQLFGHLKGAFTGADEERQGLYVIAHEGTLFLDEVEEMSDGMQKKLLRVLEESLVWPVGAKAPKKVDVRVLAASNRNLKEMVRQKKFREDLYYRLNTMAVELPPLRSRVEDIPLLVEHFMGEISRELGQPPRTLSDDALRMFSSYSWPGNIRELRNELRRAFMSSPGTINGEHLSVTVRAGSVPIATSQSQGYFHLVDDFERKILLDALEKTGWNLSATAAELGVNRNTLKTKIRRLGIERPISS
jgi:transcriptional regulator with PAS, ATPase and Fis domain